MQQVQLNDRLYSEAQRRPAKAGFPTVDEYVAEVLTQDLADEAEDLNYLFTPDRIAELDQISAEVKAGAKTYTIDEVQRHYISVPV